MQRSSNDLDCIITPFPDRNPYYYVKFTVTNNGVTCFGEIKVYKKDDAVVVNKPGVDVLGDGTNFLIKNNTTYHNKLEIRIL